MSILQETVFIGRDNAIRIQLTEDGEPLSQAYPTMIPTRWTLTVGPDTVDSEVLTSAFVYTPEDSVLELRVGSGLTTPADYTPVTLIMYTNDFPNGIVWLHPTCTPSELQLRVCNQT